MLAVFTGKVDSNVCALDEMKFFTGNGMCHSRCLAEIGLARWTKMAAAAFHVKSLHRWLLAACVFALSKGLVARLNSAGSKNGNGIFRKHGQSICQHAGNLSQASLVFAKRDISIVFGCFWLIVAEGRPGCSSFPYSLKTSKEWT